MSGPFDEALKAQPEPINDMRIQKLRDGGYVVGALKDGGTFATTQISKALDYIHDTLEPASDKPERGASGTAINAVYQNALKPEPTFKCHFGCTEICEACKGNFR